MTERTDQIRKRLAAFRADQATFSGVSTEDRFTMQATRRMFMSDAPDDIDYLLARLDEAERTVTIDDAEMAATAVENQRLWAVVDAARALVGGMGLGTARLMGDLAAALDALDRGEAGC